jgi:putative membrane protein
MNKITNYFKQLPAIEATKFLIIFYVVGIAGFLMPVTRNLFELLIPTSLLINFFILMLYHKAFDTKHLLFFTSVILGTFVIEAIGVNSGKLFGEYIYGQSLSIKILETPIIIGFNWLMLTYGAVELIRKNNRLRSYLPVIVGLLMTIYDFLMEPVAMRTDMWSWSFNHAPIQNYLLWFVISAVIAACFELFSIKTSNKIAPRIFLLQGIFFALLHLFLK